MERAAKQEQAAPGAQLARRLFPAKSMCSTTSSLPTRTSAASSASHRTRSCSTAARSGLAPLASSPKGPELPLPPFGRHQGGGGRWGGVRWTDANFRSLTPRRQANAAGHPLCGSYSAVASSVGVPRGLQLPLHHARRHVSKHRPHAQHRVPRFRHPRHAGRSGALLAWSRALAGYAKKV